MAVTDVDSLIIEGGRPLEGTVRINSAKNSALYLILAAVLTPEPVVLRDVPRLSDVLITLEILEHVGVEVRWQGRDLHLHAASIDRCDAPYSLVSKMRASFVAMGALLGRCGEARVSMPGGCALGPRPIDRHIQAFHDLGVDLSENDGDFYARRTKPLAGRAVFEAPTVGGTQNVLLAAALGSDEVTIVNAALEPEIADLVAMLVAMGADIEGAGGSEIRIRGVRELHGVTYTPLSDRIEAGTFMLAAAATRGRITLENVRLDHLDAVVEELQRAGVSVADLGEGRVLVDARGPLRPIDVVADVYPLLPTDLQAPFGAFLATVTGVSRVGDTIFPMRFTHVPELQKLGAHVELDDGSMTAHGVALRGAAVHAADLRAGGALVIAALAAEGRSIVTGLEFIDRGYERLAERLVDLGAQVERGEPSPTAAV
jgi:UDP-N-acetylglucosamine 1-carboxyvinyltransferase